VASGEKEGGDSATSDRVRLATSSQSWAFKGQPEEEESTAETQRTQRFVEERSKGWDGLALDIMAGA
jgi:hypothetical protein